MLFRYADVDYATLPIRQFADAMLRYAAMSRYVTPCRFDMLRYDTVIRALLLRLYNIRCFSDAGDYALRCQIHAAVT